MPPIGGSVVVGATVGSADWLGLSAGASDALGSAVAEAEMLAEGPVEVVCSGVEHAATSAATNRSAKVRWITGACYRTESGRADLGEMRGLEPLTPSLQRRCSPS